MVKRKMVTHRWKRCGDCDLDFGPEGPQKTWGCGLGYCSCGGRNGRDYTPKEWAAHARAAEKRGEKVADLLTERKDASAAAKLLGRRGGKKGGPARARALTAEQRTQIALKAAKARWSHSDVEEFQRPWKMEPRG